MDGPHELSTVLKAIERALREKTSEAEDECVIAVRRWRDSLKESMKQPPNNQKGATHG
jgi:hypothetical protein